MRLGLTLIAMISVGCGIDTAAPDPGDDGTGTPGGNPTGDPGPGDPGEGTGPVTEVSGKIAADTTWSNTIHATALVTVNAGVTLTVAAGTTVDFIGGLTVQGTLVLQGTRDSKVVFRPAGSSGFAVSVPQGGAMTASYLVQTGGSLGISGTGKVTLVDTQLSNASGDLLVMSGGTLDMTYSAIGLEPGDKDTTHCDMHVSGPVSISAEHSNFATAAYGLMLYSASLADFQHTNWFGNAIDVAISPPVAANFSYSYFAKGAPSQGGLTVDNMATMRLPDAGVR
ncbi:MAG TPA: hypothetical protein VIX73_28000 [Kofleriaceae bacterium]|jgi:hypothetical protein